VQCFGREIIIILSFVALPFLFCDLAFAETYSYVFVPEFNEKGNICLWFDLLPLQN